MLANVYWSTVGGAAMNRFARQMGTPDYGFGLLAAMPHLGSLFQFPASFLIERYRKRRTLFIVAMTISRLCWVLLALIPWLLPGARRAWWPLMVLVCLCAWSAHNLAVPAWTSWMSDLIPARLRGRFFGRCARWAQPVVLVGALGVGYVVDVAEAAEHAAPGTLLQITASVLALGGLVGVLGAGCYRPIRDRPRPQSHDGPWLHALRAPLRDANFRRYLGLNFTFMLAVGFLGQYIWLYVFDVGHVRAWLANLMLVVLPRLVHIVSYPVWGRQMDRLGRRPVALAANLLMLVGPIGWFMVGQPSTRWVGMAVVMIAIFGYPGFELANFNMLLSMSSSRSGSSSGTAHVALNSMAVSAGGVLSGMMGWAMARWLNHVDWSIGFLDWRITYHALLLGASLLLRMAMLPWVVSLREPTAMPARDAIRYMGANVYSNVRQALLLPTRVVGQVSRWTYRLKR